LLVSLAEEVAGNHGTAGRRGACCRPPLRQAAWCVPESPPALAPASPGGHYFWTLLFSFVRKDNDLRVLGLYPSYLPQTEAESPHSLPLHPQHPGSLQKPGEARQETFRICKSLLSSARCCCYAK
jgi:hypothetical protein